MFNDVSLVSLKLCNMATDSWEAAADKAQMPRWWDGGSLASNRKRTRWSRPRPLDGPGPWSRCFLSSPGEDPSAEGDCVEQSLPVRPVQAGRTCTPPPMLRPRPEQTSILGRAHTALGAGDRAGSWDSLREEWDRERAEHVGRT